MLKSGVAGASWVVCLILLVPAVAGAQMIYPLMSEVRENADGSFTAVFGYYSAEPEPTTIDYGVANAVAPGTPFRGQTTYFLPGHHPRDFSLTFTGEYLEWRLLGSIARANASEASPYIPADPAEALLRASHGGNDVLVVTPSATQLVAPGARALDARTRQIAAELEVVRGNGY